MRVVSRRLAVIILAAMALVGVSGCASSKAKNPLALPTPTRGAITIALDFPIYKASQPIGVTVKNGSKATFFATSDQTDCTFLQLQQFDTKSSQWLRIGPCASPTLVTTYQIPAGVAEPFTLPPGIPGSNSYRNHWPAGQFRVALLYSDAAAGGHTIYAFSSGFEIH
jgi:hypothetical protein